ncbi:MAG TPA: GNAT family N-acetyltransferase [Anaerolineales bacterium]|nr:GNAT family N-acetyltransferase [Anaerolineales bacterium]
MPLQRFERIAEINAARWDRVVSYRPFAGHAWLAYGERVHAADRPVYLLASAPDGIETGCICWVRRREQLPVSSGLIRAMIDRYLVDRPLITCQTAVVGQTGLFTHHSTSGRIARLAAGMKQILEESGGSFLIVPYLSPATAEEPDWGEGFLTAVMPQGTYLQVAWPDFPSYLVGRGRSMRKDYRRHRNRVVQLRLQTRIDNRPPEPDRIRRLVRSVESRHGSAPLPHLDRLARERSVPGGKWIIVEREGEVVGCGLMVRDRDRIALTCLGLAEGAQNVYFELMYGAIEHAIDSGAVGVFGGGGAYDFKERLGYRRTVENRVLFFARSPRLRRLGAWLAGQETRRSFLFAPAQNSLPL